MGVGVTDGAFSPPSLFALSRWFSPPRLLVSVVVIVRSPVGNLEGTAAVMVVVIVCTIRMMLSCFSWLCSLGLPPPKMIWPPSGDGENLKPATDVEATRMPMASAFNFMLDVLILAGLYRL